MSTTRKVDQKHFEALTIDSMLKAIKKMPSAPRLVRKIEVSKKHWEELEKTLLEPSFKKPKNELIGDLYGIKIYVKPGIKKSRIYYE